MPSAATFVAILAMVASVSAGNSQIFHQHGDSHHHHHTSGASAPTHSTEVHHLHSDLHHESHTGDHHASKRAAQQYSTITKETYITTTGTIPVVVNTNIAATGIHTLIPGALTMTFSVVPAYFYLETETVGSTVITSKITTKVAITVATSTKFVSTAAASTPKKTTSSTKAATTSAKR